MVLIWIIPRLFTLAVKICSNKRLPKALLSSEGVMKALSCAQHTNSTCSYLSHSNSMFCVAVSEQGFDVSA